MPQSWTTDHQRHETCCSQSKQTAVFQKTKFKINSCLYCVIFIRKTYFPICIIFSSPVSHSNDFLFRTHNLSRQIVLLICNSSSEKLCTTTPAHMITWLSAKSCDKLLITLPTPFALSLRSDLTRTFVEDIHINWNW